MRIFLLKYCHPEIDKSADFKTNYTLAITASPHLIGPEIPPGLPRLTAVFSPGRGWGAGGMGGGHCLPPTVAAGRLSCMQASRPGEAGCLPQRPGLDLAVLVCPGAGFLG